MLKTRKIFRLVFQYKELELDRVYDWLVANKYIKTKLIRKDGGFETRYHELKRLPSPEFLAGELGKGE